MLILNFAFMLADADSHEAWYFKLASFAGGIVATFIGFFLNQRHQNDKDKIKELKEYIASLQSAANELDFYRGKLTQLSGELENLANALKTWKTNWIIPTYSIYPDFLEKCKITINTFHKNPNLVKEVSHCHFELCHILARLDLLKEQMAEPLAVDPRILTEQLKTHFINANGFKGLVDSNIPVFKATCDLILAEKSSVESQLRLQKERSLFASAED
ncbi:MAG: hypothetical protein HY043_06330 [Verrucomicrobia bacterium]|nr:hypothetical protein [Verrucomicrobiota bacterium]